MKKKDLESLVLGVKAPRLDRGKIEDLLESDITLNRKMPIDRQVVAQEVAQTPWVAQKGSQKVAQKVEHKVAQRATIGSIDLVAVGEVTSIKNRIAELADTNDRKEYLKSLGINIKVERRGNSYYFYGIKKFQGRKERFYCGRVI